MRAQFVRDLEEAVAKASADWTGLDWDGEIKPVLLGEAIVEVERLEDDPEANSEDRWRALRAMSRAAHLDKFETCDVDKARKILRRAEEYEAKCEADARSAAEQGEIAALLAREWLDRGDRSVRFPWGQVLYHLDRASALERFYGDDPQWGPVREMAVAVADRCDRIHNEVENAREAA